MEINTDNAFEVATHKFVTDASTLGLAPGARWPDSFPTRLGNGLPFKRARMDDCSAVYTQVCGCIKLTVFND